MGRAPCCDKANVKRGPWSPEEDATLKSYLETHGTGGNWIALPRKAGLRRCGKSCRLRWLNYLRPDIKHGGFTEEEDNIICTLYSQMGSRWSIIASQLPGRTDNDVKNYWNTKLKKKLLAGNTNSPTPLASTPSLPCTPKAETYNLAFSASHVQSSATLPTLTDINYGLPAANTQSCSFDPIHLYRPRLLDMSEFGASSQISHIVSPSHEGSSISDSSSIAMDNKFVSLPANGGIEDSGILADFNFGYPSDLVHGFWFQDKPSEVSPSCFPNSADFGCTNIKPQGLNQSVVNQY